MKIRNGFVSNSSSSSFIVDNIEQNKEAYENFVKLCEKYKIEYLVRNNNLYTELISYDYDFFPEFCDKGATREFEGGHGYPYDEESFVEVEDVWIPVEDLSEEDYKELKLPSPPVLKEIYYAVEKYLKKQITVKELKEEISCYYDIQ